LGGGGFYEGKGEEKVGKREEDGRKGVNIDSTDNREGHHKQLLFFSNFFFLAEKINM